jgi:hypothetical protein
MMSSDAALPASLDAARAIRQIATLDEPPTVDLDRNIAAAMASGYTAEALEQDMISLGQGPGRISPHEYFYYRMFDRALPRDQRWRFIGRSALAGFHAAAIDLAAAALVHDKAEFYARMAEAGLPIPRTLAVYAREAREAGDTGSHGAARLRNRGALIAFLKNPACYPLFLKPAIGMYSVGAVGLTAIEGDHIRLATGEIASLEQIADFIEQLGGQMGQGGFLIQEKLRPPSPLASAFGETLPTVRLMVLLLPGGAEIESAVLRIPSPRNCADNYWRQGNMLGALDAEGVIRRVVTGVAADTRELTSHPDTGTALIGLRVPSVAPMFAGIGTQSWDIALTEHGPFVLELNPGGDLNLHQLAYRRGALSDRYIAHLDQCGCRIRHRGATMQSARLPVRTP